MNVQNYHEAVDALQPYLIEYLIEQGVLSEKEKNFSCLNPSHEDKNPSMGVAPSGRVANCFSCGFTVNIFSACALLENKPSFGPEWNTEVLQYLGDKYGISVEHGGPITEDEIYRLDTFKAYRAAANLVANGLPSPQFSKAIAERDWTSEICKEFGIGCATDFKQFANQLKSLGFKANFLKEIDLGRSDIFGEDRLIFTIRDERGVPVGFASRNLNYTESKKDRAKYVNMRCTGLKCNIYQKSTRLYGFDHVLKQAGKKAKPLYIFEGYSDVVTAAAHGLHNCVALGGTTLTVDQISLLRQHGYYHVILCLDGDEAGKKNVARILDSVLSGQKDLRVDVVVPPAGFDPDKYIREFSVAKFEELAKRTAFEWRLEQFDEEVDGEEVCKSVIPLIVNEGSYITQEAMCKSLAKFAGMTLKSIQQELGRLQNLQEAEKARDRKTIIDLMVNDCNRDPSLAEHAIHTAESALYEIARRYDEDTFSEENCLGRIRGLKETEESRDGSFSGFKLGKGLEALQAALCGQWKKDVWFCIGGKPNSGKTSLMCKFIYSIASELENDACVIYHTIDDTLEQVLPKFVCIAEGSKRLTLNQVMDPNFHMKEVKGGKKKQSLLDKRETGYQLVDGLIKTGRLIIKDANDGCTLAFADRLIHYYKQKFPERNIVYVLDNFHKVDGGMKGDERVRFKELSKAMKHLATKHHILVASTVEYRKTQDGKKAHSGDIGETIQIEYDANLIAHVHNELHEQRALATHVHLDTIDGEEKKLPRVEFDIAKNKVTAFKESIWFDFWPSSSDFCWVKTDKVLSEAAKYKETQKNETSEQREIYRQVVQECLEKGQKIGAAYYICKDEHGFEPPIGWKKEFE